MTLVGDDARHAQNYVKLISVSLKIEHGLAQQLFGIVGDGTTCQALKQLVRKLDPVEVLL